MPPLLLVLSFFPNSFSLARRFPATHAAKDRGRGRSRVNQSIERRMRHSPFHLDQRLQREVEEEPRPGAGGCRNAYDCDCFIHELEYERSAPLTFTVLNPKDTHLDDGCMSGSRLPVSYRPRWLEIWDRMLRQEQGTKVLN